MTTLPRMFAKPRQVLGLLGAALLAGALLAACTGSGSLAAPEGWSGPVVVENVLYLGARDGHILALDRAKLGGGVQRVSEKELQKAGSPLLWQFPLAGQKLDIQAIYSDPVVSGQTLYAAVNRLVAKNTRTGNVYALETAKGSQVWPGPFQSKGLIYSTPLLNNGTLYLTDDKGWLYALNATDGTKLWEKQLSQRRLWATPVMADGVLYISGMDKHVYAVKAATQELVWSTPFAAGGAITSSPLVLGNTLYIGAFDRELHAIDRKTGQETGKFPVGDWIWNDLATADGTLYFGTLGGKVHAVRADTLAPVWTFPQASEKADYGAFRAAPLIRGDRLLLAARNGNILTVNRQSGALINSTSVEAEVLASMALSPVDGKLYIADIDQKLHELTLPKA